jgi:hypothetical protein
MSQWADLAITKFPKVLQLILEKNSFMWLNLIGLAATWQFLRLEISRSA